MLLATDIFDTVLTAKCVSGCWANILVQRGENGDNIECDEKKFMLLIQWIMILEVYYCNNFDATTQSSVTPDYPCLTQSEAEELLAKLKILIGD